MANKRFANGWGQAAANNNIGYGQGAANNDIRWGFVHADTWNNPTTDLVGLNQAQIDFRNRVELDGGTVESLQCVIFPESYENNYEFIVRVLADGGAYESIECI